MTKKELQKLIPLKWKQSSNKNCLYFISKNCSIYYFRNNITNNYFDAYDDVGNIQYFGINLSEAILFYKTHIKMGNFK